MNISIVNSPAIRNGSLVTQGAVFDFKTSNSEPISSVNYLTIFQDFPAFLHIMQPKGWGSEEPGTRSYGTVNLMKVQTSSPLQHLNLLTIVGSFPAFNTHMLTVLTQSLSVYSNWLSSSHYQLPCGIILSSTRIRCSSHKAEIPTPTNS